MSIFISTGCSLASLVVLVAGATVPAQASQAELKLSISWGRRSPTGRPFYLQFLAQDLSIDRAEAQGLEPGEGLKDGAWQTQAGGGDVDGVVLRLRYPTRSVKLLPKLHPIWADLLAQSDPDTAHRLQWDPAFRRDSRKLTVQMDPAGTLGFSVTVDQLLEQRSFWVPSLDVFLSAEDPAPAFAQYLERLSAWRGKRVLEQVQAEPEATYEQFQARWEDMGSPGYVRQAQPAPGHIVCLTWDSAIPKFGIDRGAGVWSDYGNPDRFRAWFDFGDLTRGIAQSWRGQRLADGLPVITTILEQSGVRYEVEQFAYPLAGPPLARRGDIPMVLLQKLRLTNLEGEPKTVSFTIHHRRELPGSANLILAQPILGQVRCLQAEGDALYTIEGDGLGIELGPMQKEAAKKGGESVTMAVSVTLTLAGHGTREVVAKLPSPKLPPADQDRLLQLDYTTARASTLAFWSNYVARGAQFSVPEKAVNDLFRANLWHALRLPRRHGGQEADVNIDLPYSNFAYAQTGAPWPVNQAVYVDYMIYDLRGYHSLSVEELLTMYRQNQEINGHVAGFADWLVYTPAMLYTVAQNFLLSGDRQALSRLLPPTLKSLDWCLAELGPNSAQAGAAGGLVRGPLNDGTGDGVWAFNQAYTYAGLNLLGRALERIGQPRAEECLSAARAFRDKIARGFARAAVQSPLVRLRDRTWIPYVPCEALTYHRLFEQWYPTEVDTGATHLLRLEALPADGWMADSLLNDHEDNLYLHAWGMANEPVYNPQATAYLLRDDPQAAIRAFYSYMACAFSHSVFEPVEHRWTWGQYFGPPSTDGAWFDLYRHLVIREMDNDRLLLFQATPRQWLQDGNRITVERAPTFYGPLSMTLESHAASGRLRAEIQLSSRRLPKELLVRFRHPQARLMRAVTVNDRAWTDFDRQKEWVRVPHPALANCSIVARY